MLCPPYLDRRKCLQGKKRAQPLNPLMIRPMPQPQHLLNFFPLPQGQGSFLPVRALGRVGSR